MKHPSSRLQRPNARLLLFFLLLILQILFADWVIDSGLRKISTGTFGSMNAIYSGRVNAEVVISGSSRAMAHYDSRVIESVTGLKTFNIGRNGSQTDMQVAVLKMYLERNTAPKIIIHNLDLFTFKKSRDIYDRAQYQPYLQSPSLYEAIRRIDPKVWLSRYIPLYGYAVEDLRLTWVLGGAAYFNIQPKETEYSGFEPRYLSWTSDFEAFRSQHPNGVAFEFEREAIYDLQSIVNLCAARGITIIMSYSPVYWEMQKLERNREEIFEQFRAIAKAANSPLWDFSRSSICLDRENFYNSQHLNARGAELFSRELAQMLKGYLEDGNPLAQ